MSDRTYLIRFKHPALGVRSVAAASAEIHGEHTVLLNSKGELTALFLTEDVDGWSELPSYRSRCLARSVGQASGAKE